MIRPLTCVCFLLALCSGAYLYLTKYDALLLDRRIEKTLKDTEVLREQTRMLHAEWTLLNDPERLRLFADRYLSLKPVTPQQFTSLTDLDLRLPAIRPPNDEAPADLLIPQQSLVEPAQAAIDAAPAAIEEDLPIPPLPTPPPLQIASAAPVQQAAERKTTVPRPPLQAAHVVEPLPKPAAQIEAHQFPARYVEPRNWESRAPEQRAPEQRVAEQRPGAVASRPIRVDNVPIQARAPIQAQAGVIPALARGPASAPLGGSLLGMSQGSSPAPLPRPMPIGNASFNGGN
jgi:hypothetical protein